MAGTGSGSAFHSNKLAKDAKDAGADGCIVISPAYFGPILKNDRAALMNHFKEILDGSPLPCMIYK